MRCIPHFLLCIASALLLAPGAAQAGSDDCRDRGALTPLCIGHAAEDIEPLPDHRHLLLSNYAGWDGTPGTLALLDTQTLQTSQLYPLPQAAAQAGADQSDASWGDSNCPGAIGTALSPHGVHLSRRADGQWQLLVVNHGGRESVELFAVLAQNNGYQLRWRGCVIGPAGSFFNDVAAVPGNENSAAGFVVTQMFDRNDATAAARAARGENTGHVLRWQPQSGFSKVTGSDGVVPNGIQTTPDGRLAFVNYSGNGEVRKLDLQQGRSLGSVAIRQPDNSAWTTDGQLLQISQLREMDFNTCAHQQTGFCDIPFAVYVVDPATLAARKIFEHSGAPFGAATVAVQMDGFLYLGTFAGDRIAKLPMPVGDKPQPHSTRAWPTTNIVSRSR
jgi:sugar lactone lactonase YvrE